MKPLDPDLKRLMRWSRHAPSAPEQAPYGFAGRVVAQGQVGVAKPVPTMQDWVKTTAWISFLVILCGSTFS